jgi:hypothetical protein
MIEAGMEPHQLSSKTAGVVFGSASSPVELAILNVSKAGVLRRCVPGPCVLGPCVLGPRCAKIRNDFGPVVDPDSRTYGSGVRAKSAAKSD